MARYSKTHKAQTHAEIIGKAAQMVREDGLDGTGVAQVMKAVGLTHGGFYAHFEGKDAMLAAAMAEAIAPSKVRIAMLSAKAKEVGNPGLIAERYLSVERSNDVANGCAAAALASELHRAPLSVRKAFAEGARATAEVLDESGLGWARYAMLVGGLAIIRALPEESACAKVRQDIAAAFVQLTANDQGAS